VCNRKKEGGGREKYKYPPTHEPATNVDFPPKLLSGLKYRKWGRYVHGGARHRRLLRDWKPYGYPLRSGGFGGRKTNSFSSKVHCRGVFQNGEPDDGSVKAGMRSEGAKRTKPDVQDLESLNPREHREKTGSLRKAHGNPFCFSHRGSPVRGLASALKKPFKIRLGVGGRGYLRLAVRDGHRVGRIY